MKVSLLTIGDELLIGQVLNSNAHWIGEQLVQQGIKLESQLTVGDDESSIIGALNFLKTQSDVILMGGGLGPTHDDITLEVVSKFVSDSLVEDREWLDRMRAYFESRNRVMTPNNHKQAMVLSRARRLDNDCGTAPGQQIHHQGTEIFIFPGVPHEMKSMFQREILPWIQSQRKGGGIFQTTLLTTGIGESALAQKCEPFVQKVQKTSGVSLAFLPSQHGVRLRLMLQSSDAQAAQEFQKWVQELKSLCGDDAYGFEPDTLESKIIEQLAQKKCTLALAESCTGGLITHRLTQVPGASQVFRGGLIPYQEKLKTLELEIPPRTFQERGVVSETVAKAMAWSIQKKWDVDYALSTTGYLGPSGGDAFAPVGTVCMAIATRQGIIARTFLFEANRERAKERAAQTALDLLRRQLLGSIKN